jgi:hypothetical protein
MDMKKTFFIVMLVVISISLVAMTCFKEEASMDDQKLSQTKWKVHDPDRPLPSVVDPGPAGSPILPPSDAVILFDGKDLSQWQDNKGQPARWSIKDGYMEVVKKTGSILTKQTFGDCQLHVEWAAPVIVKGKSQGRGNSGVFLMNTYEVQVLDSYENVTYADGLAAAVYGQYPPLVNVCRPPGEWQTYDIIFRRPHFDENGKVLRAARMTVFHNGVLVHDNVKLSGRTVHKMRAKYTAHPDRMPISLQDHGDPVRYRNIWIRSLSE